MIAGVRTMLPVGFIPTSRDVICGRSRSHYHHVGNEYFREIVAKNVQRYLAAKSKLEKGCIIVSIVDAVRSASPEGGFVRQDPMTGGWFMVDDAAAREKVGATMRTVIRTRGNETFLLSKPQDTIDNAGDPATANVDPLLDWIPPSIVASVQLSQGDEQSLVAEDFCNPKSEVSVGEIFDYSLWKACGLDLSQDEWNLLVDGADNEDEMQTTQLPCNRCCSCCQCKSAYVALTVHQIPTFDDSPNF